MRVFYILYILSWGTQIGEDKNNKVGRPKKVVLNFIKINKSNEK